MPLPDPPVTITGGCSCGAVRYRVSIPEASTRPSNPFQGPDSDERMPAVITCHCNDCRRATSSGLPQVIIQIPAPLITVSALAPAPPDTKSSQITGRILDVLSPDYNAAVADASRPPYVPAMEALRATTEAKESWLRFFHSEDCGPSRSRSFCGRCGAQVCYHLAIPPEYTSTGKLPDGWSDLFDIYLGSVDREFLENDWLVPEAELQFKHGTLLGKRISVTAKPLKHLIKMQEWDGMVEDEELRKLAN